jgi:hypothetical protein
MAKHRGRLAALTPQGRRNHGPNHHRVLLYVRRSCGVCSGDQEAFQGRERHSSLVMAGSFVSTKVRLIGAFLKIALSGSAP